MDAVLQFIADNFLAIIGTAAGVIAAAAAVLALLKRREKTTPGRTVEVHGDNPGVIVRGDVGGDVIQRDGIEGHRIAETRLTSRRPSSNRRRLSPYRRPCPPGFRFPPRGCRSPAACSSAATTK